jgi:hypothetical protein
MPIQKPAPAAQSYRYRVLETPAADLDAYVRNVWAQGLHAIPFPRDWQSCWADLSDVPASGLTVWGKKLLLFDAKAHQNRSARDFLNTVCHELTHLAHPAEERHGQGFQKTLKRLFEYVAPLVGPSAPASPFVAPLASRPRTRPEGEAGENWMSPENWLKVAKIRQQLLDQEIANEKVAARAIDTMERDLRAKVRAQRAQDRAATERCERDGIALYARASDGALALWQCFVKGRVLSPPNYQTMNEKIGKQLYECFPGGRPSLEARQARFARTGYWEPL